MEENLRKLNKNTVGLINQHTNEVINVDSNPLTDDKTLDELTFRGNSYSKIVGNVDGILKHTAKIQKNATEYTKYAYTVLDENKKHLSELNDDAQKNIHNLNIQKDNKKRIIEIQRNRLLKYKFIKQTLLYLLVIILVCGVVLYIGKLLGESIKPFSSILLVAIISIFIIFLIFRYIDYNRRSKFNFNQYNINTIGDKYDKTIFEYDRDQLQFMGGNVFDELDNSVTGAEEELKSSLDNIQTQEIENNNNM